MQARIRQTVFWAGVLLCTFMAVNVWPARVALGPVGTLEDEDFDNLDVARVVHYGCASESPVVKLGRVGWLVVVWADYTKKEKGQAHDWEKWLSFRSGKDADKKADSDCREWCRALAKRIEKARGQGSGSGDQGRKDKNIRQKAGGQVRRKAGG